jgi:hypothetical protein
MEISVLDDDPPIPDIKPFDQDILIAMTQKLNINRIEIE